MFFFETVKGFAADEPVYKEGALAGVQLRDVGIAKNGKEKETYEPGEESHWLLKSDSI